MVERNHEDINLLEKFNLIKKTENNINIYENSFERSNTMKRFFRIEPKNNKISYSNEKLESSITSMSNGNGNFQQKEIKDKDVCLVEDSPYYIHKVAQTDRLDEFKKLYFADPTRLYLKDTKGWLPIHYAALRSKTKTIDFIVDKGDSNMINQKDGKGNTPLHIAIEKGDIECCRYLIDKNADLAAFNKDNLTPIHYCIACQKPDVLDFILGYAPNADPSAMGASGGTPLHACAFTDNLECAKVLVKHGASLCTPCKNGYFPVHLAASKCSNKVLEFLLNEGAKMGCSKLKMVTFIDADNNKPLHSAVQVCNMYAVKLCLDSGAKIDETNDSDLSTAVHIACTQGSLDILKLLFEKQPELKQKVIHMTDINQMTPLHKASMFDHVEIIDYLLQSGADIDAFDKEKFTPLLLASSKNSVNAVCHLLMSNANIRLRDSKLRNVLHHIVNQNNPIKSKAISSTRSNSALESSIDGRPDSGSSIHGQKLSMSTASLHSLHEVTRELIKRKDYQELFNEQDSDGCTVMHYASKLGLVSCLRSLIQYGASVITLNNEKQSPLHFAARYGRYNSCLQVLSSGNYKNYINEKDSFGQTPLHLAAQNGHVRVVKLLMQKGALIYRSYNGNSPFHEAAKNAYTNCMSAIYSIDNNVVDFTNKNGDTALHVAAKEGHANVVEYLLDLGARFVKNKDELTFMDIAITNNNASVLLTVIAHQRWQEALNLFSKLYKTPFLGIIEFSSEVTQAVLERCITRKDLEGSNGKKYQITYNFKYINWSDRSKDKNGKEKNMPMLPLLHMVKFGRTDCLSHKLCETMLKRKWDRYGLPLYVVSLGMYLIFLAMMTTIVTTHPSCIHDDTYNYYISNNQTNCYQVMTANEGVYYFLQSMHIYKILAALCILYSVFCLAKEFFQFLIDKLDYFRNFQVYIQMVLYVSTIVFSIPFLYQNQYSLHFQWEVGSIATFAAWFNLLLYMQRFYVFGIYVVMFTEILKTLLKVIFLFSILIIAFGLVFYILLRDEENRGNSTPWISIFRSITMMIGELDGLDTVITPFTDDSPYTLHYGGMTIFFEILFIILMPILLTNLLIGLAVGDIESIQKNAKLKREAMQVQLHVDIEMKMPKKILDKVNEDEFTITIGETICPGFFGGIISNILNKLNVSDHNYVETIEEDDDSNHLLYLEMIKQKQRINGMKAAMDQQTELLKLIVQKMEIKTEDDDNDVTIGQTVTNDTNKRMELWNSNSANSRLRNLVLKQLMSRHDSFEEQT